MQRFTSPPLVYWVVATAYLGLMSFVLFTTTLVFHEQYSVADKQMTQLCGIAKALSGEECRVNNQTSGCRLAHAVYVGACPPEEETFSLFWEGIALVALLVFFIFLMWYTNKRPVLRNP